MPFCWKLARALLYRGHAVRRPIIRGSHPRAFRTLSSRYTVINFPHYIIFQRPTYQSVTMAHSRKPYFFLTPAPHRIQPFSSLPAHPPHPKPLDPNLSYRKRRFRAALRRTRSIRDRKTISWKYNVRKIRNQEGTMKTHKGKRR